MIYSLDDTNGFKRRPETDNLYDIFGSTVIYDLEQEFYVYVIPEEFDMRIDLISEYIYGNTNFIEELMVINNIYNPWSVKAGDDFLYFDIENINMLHSGKDKDDTAFDKLTQFQDKKPDGEPSLSPTMKPKGFSQVTNDKKEGKLRITNKLE